MKLLKCIWTARYVSIAEFFWMERLRDIRELVKIVRGDEMEQIDLFESVQFDIPKSVKSPLECKKGMQSQEFIKNQLLFREHVRSIQLQNGCSWFVARDKFFEMRGTDENI